MRELLRRAAHVVRVVIHDPEVQRSGKALMLLAGIRLALALGASVQLVELVEPVVRDLLGL